MQPISPRAIGIPALVYLQQLAYSHGAIDSASLSGHGIRADEWVALSLFLDLKE
jgi:hypothetical protein